MLIPSMIAAVLACGTISHEPPGPGVPANAALGETGYKLAQGPYEVGMVETLVLHDGKRNKDLEVLVRFPKAKGQDTGPWPIVVFSHGAGGSKRAFPELTAHWASHGYVVIAPTHSDSISQRVRDGKDAPRILDPEGRAALRGDVNPADRVADVKLILDMLDEVEAKVEGLRGPDGKGRIDRTRAAMAGHSAGALTTQWAIGIKGLGSRVGIGPTADPRFKCGLVISGQGVTGGRFNADSWSEIMVPILVITGSLDTSPPQMGNETPETRQHPFVYSRGTAKGGPPAYLLFIEGATHSSYAGKATSRTLGEKPTTDVEQIQKAVASATLATLDAHVKADEAARAFLTSERMKDVIPGKVRWEHK